VTTVAYQLAEIDLTRHVRTPAGEAYFYKPIGSPIGGKGSAAPKAKTTVGKAYKTAVAERRSKRGNTFGGQGPGPAITGSTSAEEIKRLNGGRKPRLVPASKMAKRDAAKGAVAKSTAQREALAADVRKDLRGSGNDNLWQLDNKRLTAAIDDPNTPADRKRALRVEKAQRIAMVQNLLKDKKEVMANPEVKAAVKSGDSGRISKALHAHAPKAVAKAWDKLVKNPAHAIKNADHAQALMDGIWDFIVKAAGGVLAVAIFGLLHGVL